MKILLVYLQPKNIDEVLEELKFVPCDKLFLRYIPYPDVYKLAMKAIKLYSEYTHILWLQNDIVLTREDFLKLKYHVENFDLEIIGASMNVDLTEVGLRQRAYSFYPQHNAKDIDWTLAGEYEGVIQVKYSGGAFLARRDILLKCPMKGQDKRGYNADLDFCENLIKNKIPYFLDTRIHLRHLRYEGEMLVNKKKPEMEFIRW